MSVQKIPFHDLLNATLQALHELNGSGRNQEIHDKAVAIMNLTEVEIAELYKPGVSNQTRISYRLGWARTHLRRYGLLQNSSRGVWTLTARGKVITEVDGKEVERVVNEQLKQEKKDKARDDAADLEYTSEILPESDDPSVDAAWRDLLYAVLKDMEPTSFERLCQLILRESGFTKVNVTQASHDGGIDGWGILQVSDFLTFRVVFQCKRYDGSVGPDVVQKLRGAMPGNADRGLIVTTGRFTKGAIEEAAHEHKSPIELVDGEELINKLQELELGVSTEMVPEVTINPDFFANI